MPMAALDLAMLRHPSWVHALAVHVLLSVGTGAGMAQEIPGYPRDVYAADPREMAMVPKFCPYTILFRDVSRDSNQSMIAAWSAQIGEGFQHLHHYCAGLIKFNRAQLLARDAMTRKFYLSDAIVEYDYVILRVREDFVLLPEIVTKKGEALLSLGKGPLAVYEFERAIQLKADYWPPYAKLGDYFKHEGDLERARAALESGLKQAPDVQALRRRLADLNKEGARPSSR
jgi:tetratricopeptide (TPR) repeat protein